MTSTLKLLKAASVFAILAITFPHAVLAQGPGGGGPITEAPVISGPTSDPDGGYTISWTSVPRGVYYELREKVGSGTWANAPHSAKLSATFAKPLGIYSYRVRGAYGGVRGPWSDTLIVAVGTTIPSADDNLVEQLRYTYATRFGAINGDNRNDIYLYRTSGGDAGNGNIDKIILKQTSGGKFTFIVPTASQISTASAWQSTYIPIVLEDVNVDGFVDVALSEISATIPGGLDLIVYAPAQILHDLPKGLTNITTAGQNSFQSFYDEFTAWVDDPNYYEDHRIWVEQPGHWDYDVECDWFEWGQRWEYECWMESDWVDGPEYWSYDHFNQNGYRLAKEIAKILNGNPDASVWGAVHILEQVLGVEIGGWDLDIPFPGDIDANVHVGYSLILAIASTENVRTGQTPACIANTLQTYHNTRLGNFLSPGNFNSVINNNLASHAEYLPTNPNEPFRYAEVDMWGDSWSSNRHPFIQGFGWFDARHATLSFAIVYNRGWMGSATLALVEMLWESVLQGCTSANIREDILSNAIGGAAAELYLDNYSKSPAQHMRNRINATLLSQSQAQAALIAAGEWIP